MVPDYDAEWVESHKRGNCDCNTCNTRRLYAEWEDGPDDPMEYAIWLFGNRPIPTGLVIDGISISQEESI